MIFSFQSQRVPCSNYVSGSSGSTGSTGSTATNAKKGTGKNVANGNGYNNASWTTSSQGNLVIIILSVLAGIFLVALIFLSIMFAALRKSILVNGGSKGRGASESTASAASYLTTVTDKDISSIKGSPKYHHINATRFRTFSNAKGSPPVKPREEEIILSKHEGWY